VPYPVDNPYFWGPDFGSRRITTFERGDCQSVAVYKSAVIPHEVTARLLNSFPDHKFIHCCEQASETLIQTGKMIVK